MTAGADKAPTAAAFPGAPNLWLPGTATPPAIAPRLPATPATGAAAVGVGVGTRSTIPRAAFASIAGGFTATPFETIASGARARKAAGAVAAGAVAAVADVLDTAVSTDGADVPSSAPRVRATTNVPAATTSSVAAIFQANGSNRLLGADAGITPRGALSRDVRILDEAAMNPRASATAAAHSRHSAACASTRAASSGVSAPSSHE